MSEACTVGMIWWSVLRLEGEQGSPFTSAPLVTWEVETDDWLPRLTRSFVQWIQSYGASPEPCAVIYSTLRALLKQTCSEGQHLLDAFQSLQAKSTAEDAFQHTAHCSLDTRQLLHRVWQVRPVRHLSVFQDGASSCHSHCRATRLDGLAMISSLSTYAEHSWTYRILLGTQPAPGQFYIKIRSSDTVVQQGQQPKIVAQARTLTVMHCCNWASGCTKRCFSASMAKTNVFFLSVYKNYSIVRTKSDWAWSVARHGLGMDQAAV